MFVIATILYTDAANTVVVNTSLYGRVVFGMGDGEIRNLLILSIAFGALGAAGFGFLTDRLGPKRSLVLVIVCWLVAVATAVLAVEAWMLLAAGPLFGVALGATWVVSRVMLISLSPPEKLGEFFGFYVLAGRFSAVTGPALTGAILTVFSGLGPGAYRLALFSLAITLTASLILVLRLPDSRPSTQNSSS